MLKSTSKLISQGWQKHLIRDVDLQSVFAGTDASRYALIHKALRAKELIQLRRGLYMLAPQDQIPRWSQYYLANHIAACSFVTAESALSFHGWIPEKITQVTNAIAFGRSKTFDTPLGDFVYRTFPLTKPHYFLYGVYTVEIETHLVWMATALRALMDYVYWHKIDNADTDFLIHGLRIDELHLKEIKKTDIQNLLPVYHSKRVQQLLKNILKKRKNHG